MTSITPTNGMRIAADTTLAAGTYYLPDGLEIAAGGITLDGNGALLIGSGRSGSAVRLAQRRGVTIKNLRVLEYYHGIAAHHCSNLVIANCSIRGTAEEPANTLFLDIWRPVEQAYGGAILLNRVQDTLLVENDLQHQQNGLLAYHSARLELRANTANHCSGFGFHFFDTSDSLIEGNYADFCCRYEPRGTNRGHLGADAAGFLIAHGSCRNIFRGNYARMGGDGFFLAGLRPDWAHVPCDQNLFERNDASHSPNIAFEATFSRGNIYRHNRANSCNYGFWLGFSRENSLEHNEIQFNQKAGIAVENGIDFRVIDNAIVENSYGILLWSKYVEPFAKALPENDTSRSWQISQNRLLRNRVALRVAANQDHGVRRLATGGQSCPTPHTHVVHANQFEDNRVAVEYSQCEPPRLAGNLMRGNLLADTREV